MVDFIFVYNGFHLNSVACDLILREIVFNVVFHSEYSRLTCKDNMVTRLSTINELSHSFDL